MFGIGDVVDVHYVDDKGNRGDLQFRGIIINEHPGLQNDGYYHCQVHSPHIHPPGHGLWVKSLQLILRTSAWKKRYWNAEEAYDRAMKGI